MTSLNIRVISFKAVVRLVDYRLKLYEEDLLYKSITAEYLATIAMGRTTETRISFVQERKKIYEDETEKDTRTAEEIICDTCRKHGIKIVE